MSSNIGALLGWLFLVVRPHKLLCITLEGMVLTEMGDKEYEMIAGLEGCSFEEARDALAQQNALKRGAQPEEVASVVTFLATDSASFMTGVALPISAGQPAGL